MKLSSKSDEVALVKNAFIPLSNSGAAALTNKLIQLTREVYFTTVNLSALRRSRQLRLVSLLY